MDMIEKANQMMNEGKADDAMALLREKAQTASDDEKYTIIDMYYGWGFFEEGIALLEELIAKYPDEGELMILLTEMYIELQKDEEAIQLLNDIKKEDPFYLEALLLLADLYQAQGLFEVTEQKLLEAKSLAPDEMVIDFALGEFLFSIGQASRAIPFYEKVIGQTEELNGIEIGERLAESHATLGHYDEALAYFKALESENPDILFKYGFTAAQQHRNDIAIPVWQKLLEIDPYYHTVYHELANALKEEGRIDEAYEVIQDGLKQDEFNKELYMMAAHLAIQLQKRTEAYTYLKEAVVLDHDYKAAVMMLIELYKEDEQYEAIIELVTTIQDMGADDPLYSWELAQSYEAVEKYEEALHHYEMASIHLTHDADFLKEFGYFLSEEGQFKEALKYLTKYLTLEPLDEDIQAFVERLNDSNND